jgi:large subunit ribosomal protein L4
MATVKKQPSRTKAKPAQLGVSTRVVGTDGKAKGSVDLPKDLFAHEGNATLLAQAVRVFRANQREGSAQTKTRGEVAGSTRKIYRQKGTGRARHGAIRAPIFVGGGIVFGPRARLIRRTMPQKMRRAALAAALTQKNIQEDIHIVSGFAELAPKTKVMAGALAAIGAHNPILMVISKDAKNVAVGMRNIPSLDVTHVHQIHAYEILSHRSVVFMKEALSEL